MTAHPPPPSGHRPPSDVQSPRFGSVTPMSQGSIVTQRLVWTRLIAVVTFVFWLVGVGCGWRGVILDAPEKGIVAKAQAFGDAATVWWVPAAVLTLTVAVMGIGVSLARHLTDTAPVAAEPDDGEAAGESDSATVVPPEPLELEPADDEHDSDADDDRDDLDGADRSESDAAAEVDAADAVLSTGADVTDTDTDTDGVAAGEVADGDTAGEGADEVDDSAGTGEDAGSGAGASTTKRSSVDPSD